MNESPLIDEVAAVLEAAQRVLVITGAGISADSGLPTYRGSGGLYEFDLTEDGVAIEVAMSGQMLQQRPDLTWKYLSQMEHACRYAKHNAAHTALAQMQHCFQNMTVLTQNIDGFHRDAGTESLIEIHGNIHNLFCTECGAEWHVRSYSDLIIPPRCEDCAGAVRPNVVLFGEMLPADALERLRDVLRDGVDLVMTIGTSSVFSYISGPVIEAARAGVATVEINSGESEVSDVVRYRITGRAVDVLPVLANSVIASRRRV